jgi:hypothetical protein
MFEILHGIYRSFGWPDIQNFRKEDCTKAVLDAMAERYPRTSERHEVETGLGGRDVFE